MKKQHSNRSDPLLSPTLPVREITPHSGTEAFTDALRSIVRDFPQSRALAWRMLLRDTKAMYRKSLLGYLWIILPPLATVFVWVFLNDQNLVNINTGDVPYPLFVLTGTVLWTAFNGSVMTMQGVVGSAGGMLSKVNFPHEALILLAFGKTLMNSVIPALVIVPALFIYDIDARLSMLLFPVGFLVMILLGCALGLIFVPIGSLYSDVGRMIQLGLKFGFFVTPVIYALPASGLTRTLLLWNPVTAPLVSSRAWLIGGESAFAVEMLFIFLASLVLMVLATIMFKVVMPHLIERLS
ncbi:ABC transporter permease [Pseudomonadota bacterium]